MEGDSNNRSARDILPWNVEKGWLKKVAQVLSRHIHATVRDKVKRISPKRS